MTTVALVGPDGSGKTTVADLVRRDLDGDVGYVYCGTNPDMGGTTLVTTRLAARLRGGVSHGQPERRRGRPSVRSSIVAWLRAAVWLSEELVRGRRARRLAATTPLVLRDRDFLVDRLVLTGPQPAHERFHRWALARWYPAPDVVLVLDVDAEVAFARKGELDLDELELRRQGYLSLGRTMGDVRVVDARRPAEDVAAEVVAVLRGILRERHQS